MAIGQGAAGVRIKINDQTEVQIVNEPLAVAGLVGFSSKGPLNKIIPLNSTAAMDSIIGNGYNNSKYNQALYAARGVLNAGGSVEFVRPYGETIITDETDVVKFNTNQQLKSDAFVVAYDFAALATESIDISHYSATRWHIDQMAVDFTGASRQIYRISDAIVNNTNINFVLNSDVSKTNSSKIPLFAIINEDPTAANRADAEDAAVTDVTSTGRDYLSIKTAASNSAGKVTQTLSVLGTIGLTDATFTVKLAEGTGSIILSTSPSTGDSFTQYARIDAQTILPASVTYGVTTAITVPDVSNYSIGDKVSFNGTMTGSGLTAGTLYPVTAIIGNIVTLNVSTVSGTALVGSVTLINVSAITRNIKNAMTVLGFGISLTIPSTATTIINIVAIRGVKIPKSATPSTFSLITSSVVGITVTTSGETETTSEVLIENNIGRNFVLLGFAVESYIDINFDGIMEKVYTLTADGIKVASIYLSVDYLFAGNLYSFAGTIVPYVFGDQNMYIGVTAENQENGFKFIVNEHPALFDATSDTTFDFTQTVANGTVSSNAIQTSFNSLDPAITNNAIWTYEPKNNNKSAILSDAWNLYLQKDFASSNMLVAAGTAIRNLFVRGLEEIDYNVMEAMLTICEKRKDIFAIFDGVDEPRVDIALKKMVGIGSQGSDIGRWGAIFDGRSIFSDNVYTKLNVEVVKSIELSQIITANRASGVYWLAPAGHTGGRVPSSMASRQKFMRAYGFGSADENSDIAKLYDSNINPTRVTAQGTYLFGQKTMLRRNTAMNRLNVVMLVTGIHRKFADFLDKKTFQMNTVQLRNTIQAELQAQVNAIKTANPPGLTDALIICDDSNNTQIIIDTNQLMVDVRLQPSRAAEFITLRTTLQRTGAELRIADVTIIGG